MSKVMGQEPGYRPDPQFFYLRDIISSKQLFGKGQTASCSFPRACLSVTANVHWMPLWTRQNGVLDMLGCFDPSAHDY